MSAGEALGGEALAAVTAIYNVVAKVPSHSNPKDSSIIMIFILSPLCSGQGQQG
jgi:hypothetical protein